MGELHCYCNFCLHDKLESSLVQVKTDFGPVWICAECCESRSVAANRHQAALSEDKAEKVVKKLRKKNRQTLSQWKKMKDEMNRREKLHREKIQELEALHEKEMEVLRKSKLSRATQSHIERAHLEAKVESLELLCSLLESLMHRTMDKFLEK